MKAAADDVGIRLWRPGDEAVLPQLANNRRIWRNLTDRFPHPYGHEDAVRWIHRANQRPDEARHFAVLTGDPADLAEPGQGVAVLGVAAPAKEGRPSSRAIAVDSQ